MEGILLHVLYRGEKANDFASEMERSGLRAAVLAEEGCMQYDYYRPLAEAIDEAVAWFRLHGMLPK